ncbi:MAG: sulfite exporter TauE/SafE family protein [Clostridiales bacterium]|nr:sulfite exporter TauE/SafE family protein [Clostridiales bacterium]MCD8215063.1 sulfite exporter TauE/SafE family protein [Clostridiales bacterium]
MKRKFYISVLIGAFAGAANGLFGAGGGTVLVPAMEKFLRVEPKKAHASAIAVILPLSVISAVFYILKGSLYINYILFTSTGGILGSLIGAKLLSRFTGKQLHRLFGLFMIIAAARMII